LPAMILLFYLIVPAHVKERTNHFFDMNYGSNALRILWWKTGVEIFKDHPVTGIGDISTAKVYAQYQPEEEIIIGHFHNNFV